jgi:hypothetical protein|tara:strand:+ start:4651 stop:5307 length:657 start_codon:yes stop_codon:yes gene_type:complete
MADFKSCATAAGFCTVKFGKQEHINFDHNICYDLLNIEYPTSYIEEGIKEVYTFNLIIARPFSKATTQGVQVFDDEVIQIFSDLELKMWNLLSCLALGISGGGGCAAHIPKHKIQITRDKGTFNDNLVTINVQFDAIANIAVSVDPCGGSTGGETGCEDNCQEFFGACGCTDPLAINYNPTAGVDDGTCCYGAGESPCVDEEPVFPPVFPDGETNNPV